MRRGLNQQEVQELVEYIKENNSWYNLSECLQRGRKVPKYYTMQYDTRTNDMWRICFYQISGKGCHYKSDEEVVFRTENGYDLKQRIYDWLDEEYNGAE